MYDIDFNTNNNYGISKISSGQLLVDLAEYSNSNKEISEIWVENFKGKPKISISKPAQIYCKVYFTLEDPRNIPIEWVYYINSENIRLIVFERIYGKAVLYTPYSFKSMEPYTGRQYWLNKKDCYRLVVDYYKKEFNIDLGQNYFANMSWLASGLDANIKNLLILNYAKEKFQPVGSPIPGDCILISSNKDDPYPEHVAIYLENNKILHHYSNRLSTVEEYSTFWKSKAVEYLRHESRI